jgi:3',5'-cyclic AMP phosphodiesterase CpdA
VTVVGLNTAHGVIGQTLTWNLRDISIMGHLRRSQLERARAEFDRARATDARVVVMHHNPVKGELSQRHGLKNTQRILGAFAEMGVDLVLCGHDHQEAVHYIEHTRKGTVISTAGTMSNRSRGGRPSSVNLIRVTATEIDVSTMVWDASGNAFVPGPSRTFARTAEHATAKTGAPAPWDGDDRRGRGGASTDRRGVAGDDDQGDPSRSR